MLEDESPLRAAARHILHLFSLLAKAEVNDLVRPIEDFGAELRKVNAADHVRFRQRESHLKHLDKKPAKASPSAGVAIARTAEEMFSGLAKWAASVAPAARRLSPEEADSLVWDLLLLAVEQKSVAEAVGKMLARPEGFEEIRSAMWIALDDCCLFAEPGQPGEANKEAFAPSGPGQTPATGIGSALPAEANPAVTAEFLATLVRQEPEAVRVWLTRYVDDHPKCRVKLDKGTRGKTLYLYYLNAVLPDLKKHFADAA